MYDQVTQYVNLKIYHTYLSATNIIICSRNDMESVTHKS